MSQDGPTRQITEEMANETFVNALPSATDLAHYDYDPDTRFPVDFHSYRLVGKKEKEQTQQDTSNTQSGPPTKLGTKGCGKLKADQWHTCMEFDIPVSLMKLRSEAKPNEGNGIDDRIDDGRHKVLNSTMLLAMALRWGTSHRTSTKHAAEYMKNACAYLGSLRGMFPGTDRPICKNSALTRIKEKRAELKAMTLNRTS